MFFLLSADCFKILSVIPSECQTVLKNRSNVKVKHFNIFEKLLQQSIHILLYFTYCQVTRA